MCSDLDVDGDGTVERAEFFKRYQVLHRERRKATWSLQRLKKDSHTFQTIVHNPNLRLNPQSRRAWQWQPTKYRVPSLAAAANPAPVDLDTLASAIGDSSANSKWPVQPAPCPAAARPLLAAAARPSSAPASIRRHRPFSAGSRPGSATQTGTDAGDTKAATRPPQPRPSTGATKLAATVTGHLDLLKPPPVSASGAANAAAEQAWKQNHVDVLLSILERHKLKLADLFSQLDADKSGTIDREELRQLLVLMGVDVSDREKLQALFSLLDVDGDGEIQLQEFLKRMQQIQQDRAVAKAGVSRRVPILKKHPMMRRKGENYREFQAKREALQPDFAGTVSHRCGSPRPASASARMQSTAPPSRPLSATVRKAREKQRAQVAASSRPPLANTHPNSSPVALPATAPSASGQQQRPRQGTGTRQGGRPPMAPHRHSHTEKLVAVAHSRRAAERKASAGRMAIFAGVSIETAEAALRCCKDDVAVATQTIMRNKLARDTGEVLAAVSGDDRSQGIEKVMSGGPASAAKGEAAEGGGPSVLWQSTTAHRDRQRRRSAAAVAAAARAAKEQRSGAWVPIGLHVDVLEKQSMSNDRAQLSC